MTIGNLNGRRYFFLIWLWKLRVRNICDQTRKNDADWYSDTNIGNMKWKRVVCLILVIIILISQFIQPSISKKRRRRKVKSPPQCPHPKFLRDHYCPYCQNEADAFNFSKHREVRLYNTEEFKDWPRLARHLRIWPFSFRKTRSTQWWPDTPHGTSSTTEVKTGVSTASGSISGIAKWSKTGAH